MLEHFTAPGLWTGIAIGFILSIFASLIAGYYLDNFRLWIDGHRFRWQLRSLVRERAAYSRSCRHKRHPHEGSTQLLREFTDSHFFLIASLILFSTGAISRLLVKAMPDTLPSHLAYASQGLVLFGLANMLLATVRLSRARKDLNNFYNFQRYRARLMERWPEEDWPPPSEPLTPRHPHSLAP